MYIFIFHKNKIKNVLTFVLKKVHFFTAEVDQIYNLANIIFKEKISNECYFEL